MTPMPQPTPPTIKSLRVLRASMRRHHALEWLVDYCGLTIHQAGELLDGTPYPPPADLRKDRGHLPRTSVKPMAGRMAQ